MQLTRKGISCQLKLCFFLFYHSFIILFANKIVCLKQRKSSLFYLHQLINMFYNSLRLIFKQKPLRSLHLYRKNLCNFSTAQQSSLYENELSVFPEYQEANAFVSQKQHSQANEKFKRVIEILESSHQTANPIYSHIIYQASKNILNTQDFKSISAYMKKGYDLEQNKSSELAQRYLQNFIQSTVYFDLDVAYKMLDGMKQSREYSFLKGSLQILKGDSEDAISNLKQFIEANESNQDSQKTLLWRAYNNLGVANWQNQYPRFNHFNVMDDVVKKNEPNVETALYFKKALLLNNQNMKGDKVYDQIERTQDIIPKEQIARIDFYFDESGSDIPLRALSDYLLDGHHSKRHEHTLWTKFYLKHHEMNHRDTLYRPLVSIAHHCQVSEMLIKSEGLFNTALTMLDNNKTIEKALCEYYYAQMIGKIEKREQESEELKKEAREKYKQFPQWHHWMLYVSLPSLQL
ncbi:transmembrane protein, putative (macronuclear) [Tetrahymena thermophila SB210]|uniref:Transmembrane protein, putative n=1 Tax=Tetrahymena thermophila (strain SB210) TaxID=312017 RepID=Q245Y6_TETTS|nr:transmembrane protein, putative [Tetrahymena thermophila SB210]EAS03497.3 transmembrane protein, putative [Tetrahymena thermophila SB210]|eukprot:XP_001023742.3 transmembrane protein, putative [Tetrahymena thermophila SB210]